MTQDVGATLQAILAKLEKLDSIESAVKKIEANLENLEKRTQRLEDFQTTAKKDIDDLKEGINFTGQQLKDKTEAVEKAHRLYETQLAELTTKCQKNGDLLDEIHTKNVYLEAYSRRENIKFTNIEESTEIGGRTSEDTEEVLRTFLERDLGYRDARMEIRVLFWPISLDIKTVNRSFYWVTGLKALTFKCSETFPRKSLPVAKYRWELLRMPGKMELLPPSANLNRINCISEVNCGRSGKNLLFN